MSDPSAQAAASPARVIYLAVGWMFVGVGAMGAITPVLPTTCFMIAALACFARSSPRLAQRLLNHPRFGPSLRAWKTHGAIPLRIKAVAVASMAASWGVVFAISPSWLVPAAVGVVLAGVAAYLVSRPVPPGRSEAGEAVTAVRSTA
ncbi:MAG: YbaN family protein [Rhodospirillaceae bacterium]|nr:YbaN family protein [Rhodospirillaceae bacterium]